VLSYFTKIQLVKDPEQTNKDSRDYRDKSWTVALSQENMGKKKKKKNSRELEN